MNRLSTRLLCLGLVTACVGAPVEPAPQLPVRKIVDTLQLTARFEKPPQFGPSDIGAPSDPVIAFAEGGALRMTGRFFAPSADDQFYDNMALSAVRERFYQGTEPYDSTGAIHIVIDGGGGGGFAQIGAAQYTSHIYGMLRGRYRLTVELQGVVYEPGVLLDSVIAVP